MKHKEIEIRRGDRRILKTVCAYPGKSLYEYFGYPIGIAAGAHKLGQINRVAGSQYNALRAMRTGIERKEFNVLLDAENWIAGCDTEFELE